VARDGYCYHKVVAFGVKYVRSQQGFFSITAPKHNQFHVMHLERLDRSLADESNEMMNVATDFFKSLLTTKRCDIEKTMKVLECIPKRIIDKQLEAPFTSKEICVRCKGS
jgi:hypothetical protein